MYSGRRYRISIHLTYVTTLIADYGLVLVFLLVFLESAGLPFLPGEIALITAAVAAQPSNHHFSIVDVIAVAAFAAASGFATAYWLGRKGGRRLLERWSVSARYAEKLLPPSERFFERHGPKTVFLARFVAIVRATAGWLAGITHMNWWRFLFWDVLGAIAWATGYGLLAYFAGKAVADAIDRYSLYAIGVIVALVALGLVGRHFWKRRKELESDRIPNHNA
jgi:membrane protein DedA with SNARE-associated domain